MSLKRCVAKENYLIALLRNDVRALTLYRTQFEMDRGSCGQSMANFRFLSCGGQNYFTGCPSFFYVPCMKLTKKMQKNSKINPAVALH